MTARVDRPDEWSVLDDHQRRIRAIEATVPGSTNSASICCPPPLDGLIISPCSVLANDCPYFGVFSFTTSGDFAIPTEAADDCEGNPLPQDDYWPIEDTCEGQQLYMRGYLANCTGFPIDSNVQFYGTNFQGTHITQAFPVLPDSNPAQGMMLPWTPVANFYSQSGDSPLGMYVIITFDDSPGPSLKTGNYWFEFAWFDSSSVINPDFADVPINPGSEFGQLVRWNGLAWEPMPLGGEGNILQISGGVPTWV